jgi:hypothetical protein
MDGAARAAPAKTREATILCILCAGGDGGDGVYAKVCLRGGSEVAKDVERMPQVVC